MPNDSNKITTKTKITAEQAIIIMRLIRKYRCIWDRNHPGFRQHQIRYNAFKKIGSYFRLSAEDVIRKYRRYRNCYLQELKQIRNKKKSHSNLFYFDEMDFLRDVVEPRSVSNKSSASSRHGSDVNPDTDEEIPVESLDEEYSLEPMEECHVTSYDSNNLTDETSSIVEIKEETPWIIETDAINDECLVEDIQADEEQFNGSAKNEEEKLLSSEKADEEKHSGSEKAGEEQLLGSTKDNEDEFDVFSRYLAKQLRDMDKLSALETMEELQRVIFKRRIQILKGC